MTDNQLEKTLHIALNQQIHNGRQQPWLAGLHLRYGQPLLTRFQRCYQYLTSLPRHARRWLRRKLAMSLASAALLLALSGAPAPLTIQAATVADSAQTLNFRDAPTQSFRPQQRTDTSANTADLSKGPGATIVVNGNNPGTNCTLDDAITAANTDTATGNCIAGSGDDTLDIQVNVNLTAPAPAISTAVILEGNGNAIAGDNTFGPLLTVDASGNMTLNNATVSNGNNAANYGGGIFIDGGAAEINNSTITGNTVSSGGGGVANVYGSLTINDSLITNNNADAGGGLQNLGGNVNLNASAVYDNTATYGGGIRNQQGGILIAIDSAINDNQAAAGGGIANPGFSGTSPSYAQLYNSVVSGNTATQYSAGIDNVGGSSFILDNSAVSGNNNAGMYGGGIYSGLNAPTFLSISDSTITNNSVNGPGAGVWMENGQGIINRSLISGNVGSGNADDVYNSDTLTVDNYNLFGHNGLTTIQSIAGFTPGASDIVATSDGTLPTPLTDILDTVLQNNGGPTETHALTLASPALDGVTDGSCAASNEDQRHLPRGMGAGMGGPFCDIGAFELQNQSPTDVSLTDLSGDSPGLSITGFLTAFLAFLAALALALYPHKPQQD